MARQTLWSLDPGRYIFVRLVLGVARGVAVLSGPVSGAADDAGLSAQISAPPSEDSLLAAF